MTNQFTKDRELSQFKEAMFIIAVVGAGIVVGGACLIFNYLTK